MARRIERAPARQVLSAELFAVAPSHLKVFLLRLGVVPRHADQAAQQHLEQIYAFGPGAVFSDNERVTPFCRAIHFNRVGRHRPALPAAQLYSLRLGGHDVEPSVPEGRFACDAGSRP